MDDQYYRKPRPKFSVRKWVKKTFLRKDVLISLLISVPFFSFITFSNKGIIQRLSIESELKNVQGKILQAQKEQTELQRQSEALDKDAKAIEKVAREKYGMIREGETVYKIRRDK